MSLEYAEKRIKEALTLTGGNSGRARKQIIDWALDDPKLLQALTRHHLTGIVAYHMERVISGRSIRSQTPPPTPPPKPKKIKTNSAFGAEILKAVANSSSAVFGLEGAATTQRRAQASQRHINAIHQLARDVKSKDRE